MNALNFIPFFENFLALSLEAAPWLVLGLVIGGLMKNLLPTSWLEKHLKGEGFIPVLKAALLGAPLPLCSCGVLPAALGLRNAGASKSATTSFLISTPETGVDSVIMTYALLGPLMAITRPVAAIVSAITAGLLVGKTEQSTDGKKSLNTSSESCCSSEKENTKQATSCCSSDPAPVAESSSCCSTEATVETASCCSSDPAPVAESSSCCSTEATVETASCCSSDSTSHDSHQTTAQNTLLSTTLSGIHYAFTDLLDSIILWMLIGLAFSAAIQTWVPADFLAQWGSGLPAMLVMIAISIPMYVCATASTPMAAGLLLSGISPGTVLVFLLAGPASNIGSLGVIKKELGSRSLMAYLSGVAIVAIVIGLMLDAYVENNGIDLQTQVSTHQQMLSLWVAWAGLIIIVASSLRLLLKHYRKI